MKTLYLSDLDGTLLRSDEKLSPFTVDTIHALTRKGMLFSYATARSFVTASKVTKGLTAKIPAIVYNGTMVIDSASGAVLYARFFSEKEKREIGNFLLDRKIYPIVYAYIDGVEKFSYIPGYISKGARTFLKSREGDARQHPVSTVQQLLQGDVFYFSCIHEAAILAPLYQHLGDTYRCLFQKDFYSAEQWLEIMPHGISKANAAARLKEQLQVDRLVVFGDGENDRDLFALADEAYAVENAVESLKQAATAVIGSNDADGVAKWLAQNFEESK